MFIKKLVVSMIILILSITSAFAYDFANGSGTVAYPYEITNLNDLIGISGDSDSWDKYFIQTADIDASSTSTLNAGAGFSPIGLSWDNCFSGSYDGQGFTISGLYINLPDTYLVALFAYADGAIIANLGLIDNEMIGDGGVGGLAGYFSYSTISNCYTTGTVTGSTNRAGGCVADVYNSTVSNCYATGAVSGSSLLGGCFGEAYKSTISNCYATGSVTGREGSIGGLVGYLDESELYNSYATGSVTGTEGSIGGLVGYLDESGLYNSYATGIVNGESMVGGLVGELEMAKVSNSFWDNQTSGQTSSSGGIGKTTAEMKDIANYMRAGWDFGSIWDISTELNSGYPILRTSQSITNLSIEHNSTAVVLNPTISFEVIDGSQTYELYFSTEPNPTTPIIASGTVVNPISYSFTESLEYYTYYYLRIVLTKDGQVLSFNYRFRTELNLLGSGTEVDPYQIATFADLIILSEDSSLLDKYFIQTADIDASASLGMNDGAGLDPIAGSDVFFQSEFSEEGLFSGSYDGQNFTISNLNINRPTESGIALFGGTYNATISNVGLVDIEVTGYNFVAGLVALASNGTVIDNCYSAGTVLGCGNIGDGEIEIDAVGGLVAFIMLNDFDNFGLTDTRITNCYSTGTVTATGTNFSGGFGIGGLVGISSMFPAISNSYSTASVTRSVESEGGPDCVGGLLGLALVDGGKGREDSYDVITNCYSTGAVSGIGEYVGGLAGYLVYVSSTNSFWNTETSGQETSAAGIGKTTAEMQDVNLFSGATWDITDAADGGENVWKINPALNNGYPYLTWAQEDIEEQDNTLPVTLSSFNAIQTSTNLAQITWETASESGLLGYNLFRAETNNQDDALRVTATMIEATNAATGSKYSYVDAEVEFNIDYRYWLQTNDFNGSNQMFGPVTIKIFTDEDNDIEEMLLGTQMFANYPNPFNPSTTISFSVAEPQVVIIDVYNIKGQLVKHVFNDKVSEINTKHSVVWNGQDSDGQSVASGIYFTIMKTGNKKFTNKSILIK